jgi:hypothetical protein
MRSLKSIFSVFCSTTARLHSEAELAVVARACGLDKDHVAQFAEEPRLVFLQPVSEPGQVTCVRRWAEQPRLHLVSIDAPASEPR